MMSRTRFMLPFLGFRVDQSLGFLDDNVQEDAVVEGLRVRV